MAKEKEATCYMDKTSGALCSVALPCRYKVSRWVEGAPIIISFDLKSREARKEKRKLIFISQKKATHSYRRREFPIFRNFVLLVPLSISIQYFKHSSEHAITSASGTVRGSNLPTVTRTYSLRACSQSRKWRPSKS